MRYGPTVDEYADIFPAERRGALILIFIHGGFWRSLSAGDFSFCAEGLERRDHHRCRQLHAGAEGHHGRDHRRCAPAAWTFRHAEDIGGNESEIYVVAILVGGIDRRDDADLLGARDYGLPRGLIRGGIPHQRLFDLEPIKLLSFVQPDLRLTEGYVAATALPPMCEVASRQRLPRWLRPASSSCASRTKFLAGVAEGRQPRRSSPGPARPQPFHCHYRALPIRKHALLCAIFDFMGHTPRRVSTGRRGAAPSCRQPRRELHPDGGSLGAAEGLHKAFGAVKIAADISFTVAEGEVVGIIGLNGAGKNHAVRPLSGNVPLYKGLNPPPDGIYATGLPNHARARAGIARTYQVPRPFTHMTVAENLRVAAIFGGDLDEAECDDGWRRCSPSPASPRARRFWRAGWAVSTASGMKLARALATPPQPPPHRRGGQLG